MTWIAMIMAIGGAFLVTQEAVMLHFVAFCMWTYSNTYWAIYNRKNKALCIQFTVFLALALLGMYNTWGGSYGN